jgi:CheY-like chemotaxis protein
VKVSASAQYPDKQNPAFALVITIEDTGIGIPKDGGESVFASFEQLGREKNTQYGGTGLGLSITKRLVQMMNGQIYLRDKFGPGALFEVIIRNIQVASADLDQTAIKNISLSREEEQAVLFDPANILIADDVPYNRELLKGFLLKYNFTFFEAADGREALRILEMEKIDLILMDIKMPELDGKEAAEFIRGNLKTKDIPMIAITASAMKESEEKLKNIFDAYLTKPIGTTILLQGLKKFIPFTKLSVWDRKNDKRKIFTGRLEPKIIANLPQLIAEILEKLNPTWEQLRKSVKFRQAKEFAHAVGSLADEYKVSFLKDWSTGLEKEINSFNKEKIQNFLETFGLLISELKIMSRKKNK